MSIITQIFEVVSSVVTGFLTAITSALNGVVAIFWDATNGLTFIGTLMLLGLGIGLVYFAITFVTRLIRK